MLSLESASAEYRRHSDAANVDANRTNNVAVPNEAVLVVRRMPSAVAVMPTNVGRRQWHADRNAPSNGAAVIAVTVTF